MPLYDFRCSDGHRFERFLSLADYASPQACRCGAPSHRVIMAPMLRKSFAEPIQSMADGKYYSDPVALERTYQASGNPQGQNYEVVGDTPIEPYSRPSRTKKDDEETHAAISRALDEHGY